MVERVCIGFGEREGVCTRLAGTPWTTLWCDECDAERRETISRQLKEIQQSFNREEQR